MANVQKLSIMVFIISLASIIACSDRGVMSSNHTSTFPLTSGTRWHYYTSFWDVRFGDSTTVQYHDTIETFRHVIGLDSLGQLMHWTAIEDSFIILGVDGDAYEDREWYGLQAG